MPVHLNARRPFFDARRPQSPSSRPRCPSSTCNAFRLVHDAHLHLNARRPQCNSPGRHHGRTTRRRVRRRGCINPWQSISTKSTTAKSTTAAPPLPLRRSWRGVSWRSDPCRGMRSLSSSYAYNKRWGRSWHRNGWCCRTSSHRVAFMGRWWLGRYRRY